MTGALIELHATEADWIKLHPHMFPGDQDEHGAAVLCGLAISDRATRLLVREVTVAEDGLDYRPGTRGYRHLSGEFVTHQVRRAKDLGLAYLAVHNHSGSTNVGFSGPDLQSHERGYPTIVALTGRPVGGLVLAEQAVAGDIWFPDGSRFALGRTVILGRSRKILSAQPSTTDPPPQSPYHRQSLLFGLIGQQILAEAKIGIVGLGGVGLLICQTLARLGVGHIVAIDPQRVDPTNLPRLPEATRLDAMAHVDRDKVPELFRRAARRFASHKTRVAGRIARRANRDVIFEGIVGDVADDHTAKRLTDCDFVFLAADSMLARDVVNQIAYQYLIPTLQVGSKVVLHPDTGHVLDIYAVVRNLGTSPGCLRCSGLIDPQRLAEESLGDAEQVANQRYVDDREVQAPSVITLNDLGTGWAANDFMQFMVGLGRASDGYRVLRTNPITPMGPHVTVQEPEARPGCHVCGNQLRAAKAMGDVRDLPTRQLSPAQRKEVITMARGGTRKIGRSAKTGRFVKKSTVKKHPSTTITQTVPTKRSK